MRAARWQEELLPVGLLQYADVQIPNYKCMQIDCGDCHFKLQNRSNQNFDGCQSESDRLTEIYPLNCVKFLNRDWCVYVEHIVQSHYCKFLMSILDYKSCHVELKYRLSIKKSGHMRPTYLNLRASRHRPWVSHFYFMTGISKMTLLKIPMKLNCILPHWSSCS